MVSDFLSLELYNGSITMNTEKGKNMIVYEGTKADFLVSVEADTIAVEIENNIYYKMNRHTAKNEFRSWENSLEYMYKVLNDHDIPKNAGVAIEYNIPQTSKRVDFLISGYDEKQNENVIIIELKQWDKLEEVEGCDGLEHDPLDATRYKVYMEDTPAFTRGEVSLLREFIKKSISTGDNKEIIYKIENGKIKPSKSLQDSIAGMIKGNKEFIMLDEQKVVYEEIIRLSKKCQKEKKKHVIIVKGGPGTGKTVIAINLLAQLTCENQFCQYVSKNSAPRYVYSQKLKGEMKKSSVDNMFKGSGIYTNVADGIINTILVDEAHRLNAKSGMYQNLGENQIKEIISAANCSVFFIDESQRVTIKDIGSVEEISKWGKNFGAEISKYDLVSQFRCNGSDGYLAWLDNVLEIRETANYDMEEINYDIRWLKILKSMISKLAGIWEIPQLLL